MTNKNRNNRTTLIQIVLTGFIFVAGMNILDLSLVDIAVAIDRLIYNIGNFLGGF
jgi:hypothetical protein